MRAMLVAAVFTAGCLHARGPEHASRADAETLHAFDLLINDADTIDDAAALAKAKGLRRDDILGIADRAYWSFMRAEIYPPAAEIAWRFAFGERGIRLPLDAQRKDADKALAAYLVRKDQKDGREKLYAAIWELTLEMRVSCRYGPKKADGEETVQRALRLEIASGEDDVLYPLLDEGCPVEPQIRTSIIDSARLEGRVDYAIRHGAAAGWDEVKTSQFLWEFFSLGDCARGFVALKAFKVPVAQANRMIENASCENAPIDSRSWSIDVADANSYFFAAVRGRKWNLALALLPFGALGKDGETFLFQEATRASREATLVAVLKMHLDRHDPFMAYLWERGRYRFIANYALTLDWQRKAFDKLIELGKWEDAAEAAQYGYSETLRTEGILIAFRAAMAAGDFKAGRYFLARYGPVKDKPGLVTQEMYDAEKDKWFEAKKAALPPPNPEPAPKPKRKRHKPKRAACPDGDWCP